MQNKDILGNLGYTTPLYILPFDHRTGLFKTFGWTEPLTPDQIETMKNGRLLIYEAIKQAITLGIPKNCVPIFTDDIFGSDILHQAQQDGFMTFLTTEKSGVPYFDFEHGDAFGDAILKINPTFTKALVRYHSDGNEDDNHRSFENLKKLSDFSHTHHFKFVIEPLITPLEKTPDYDETIRPDITVRMISEMHQFGIEPDIWKIEGFTNPENYNKVVQAARADGRDYVGIISLGRNETDAVVESWLRAGAQTHGVIGFAIGRTIFLESLVRFQNGEIAREEAISTIAHKFVHFYNVFLGK